MKKVKWLIGLSMLSFLGFNSGIVSNAEESQTKESVVIEQKETMISTESSEALISDSTSKSGKTTDQTAETVEETMSEIRAIKSAAPNQVKKTPEGDYISDGSYVQVASKNYDIWSNFSWEKRSHSSNYYGQTLKAKGRYEHENGATYYSLVNNKNKWTGYINAKATKKVSAQGNYMSDGGYVTLTDTSYSTWQNFKWQKKHSGSTLKGMTLRAKGRYKHFNGSTYYSLFDNKGKWYGYVSANAVTKVNAQGNYISDGSYVKVVDGKYNTWQNFSWQKKYSGNSLNGKVLRAKGRYNHFNGSTYYTLFDSKGKWYGYISSKAVAKTKAQGDYIKDGRYVRVNKANYDLWQNFSFEFRGTSANLEGQILQAKARYQHFNGSTYYSIYDDLGNWRGYINSWAVTKAQKPKIELSEAEIKVAQKEMLRLVNKERRRVGVNELQRDSYFDRAANYRAREIKKNFDHHRPDGNDILDAVEEAGANISNLGAGENIAYNQFFKNDGKVVANLLFKQWMGSKGHRDNIQSKSHDYDYVGFGFYAEKQLDNSVRVYGTQLFISVYD